MMTVVKRTSLAVYRLRALLAGDRNEFWMCLAMGLLAAAFVFGAVGLNVLATALVGIALAIFLGLPGAVLGTALVIIVGVLS